MSTLFIIGFLIWLIGFIWSLKTFAEGDASWHAIGTMWIGVALEWVDILTG